VHQPAHHLSGHGDRVFRYPSREEDEETEAVDPTPKSEAKLKANDIAIADGKVVDGIVRFHAALRDMTLRRGIRDEISRYEAMTMALIDPHEATAGSIIPDFPPSDSPLLLTDFFNTLYLRYDERFVYGAPSLADRGYTTRLQWDPSSPILDTSLRATSGWPELDYEPRLSSN
jgi:hypothetical protein